MAKLRINQGINLTLDAPTTDFIVKSLSGPNNSELILSARNYGVEIRIDEDSSGTDSFKITKGSGGSVSLLELENNGSLNIRNIVKIGGFDLSLGTFDQITRGNSGQSRALVKDYNATLVVNYAGDFTGGIRIDGPGLNIGGTNYVYNTTMSFQIPGVDSNAKWLIIRDTATGTGVISFNSTKDADGSILGSLVWTREGGQPDGHRQVAGIVAAQSGTGAIAGSELRFYTKGWSEPVQRMVIDREGRVGIGVNSPTEKLETDGNVKASRFISTIPTGAPPLQVSSTTKVTNLNADLLDGYDSNDFALKAENATITGNWTFNGDITIQQGKLISYNTYHKVLYPRWGFSTNANNSTDKWQKIGTFTFSSTWSKIHIHAIIWSGRDSDVSHSTQHLVMSLDTDNSTSIVTSNYILGLYLEHAYTSGTANYPIKDARIVIPDPTNAPNVAELWIQWNVPWVAVSPEVHIILNGSITYNIATDRTDDANAASTSPPSTGTVLVPNHTSIAGLANKLTIGRTISLDGSLSGSTTFDGSSNVTINASINSGAVGTTQLADNSITTAKIADNAITTTKILDGTVTPSKLTDISTAKVDGAELTKVLSHRSTKILLGNQDWTSLIYSGFSNCSYDSANRGVKIAGDTWVKVRTRVPVHPDRLYRVKAKVKKLSGNGSFYIGAISLDQSYNELSTDQALSYNYFGAINAFITAGNTYYTEGVISGYNATTESNHNKFDPEAKYFDLVIIANYGATQTPSETVIEWLELEEIYPYETNTTSGRNGLLIGNPSDLGSYSFGGISVAMPSTTTKWPLGIVKGGSALFRVDNNGNAYLSGSLTASELNGPNDKNLLINAKNYGMELRIDEDSSGTDTFKITRGSSGSTTLLLVQNTGNVGIGTTSPSEKLEVNGNVKASQLISTAVTGTSPLQVSSTTLVTNLNSDLIDGYHASTGATADTIAARDSSGNISASGFLGSNSSNLLINAKNYGMELRIDEDNTDSETLKVTKGPNGSTTLLFLDNSGNFTVSGVIYARYDHANRFVVQSYLATDNTTISAGSSYLIAIVNTYVPSDKSLYLKRVRWNLSTGYPKITASGSYTTWTGSSSSGDVLLDINLVSGNNTNIVLYLSIYNQQSNSVTLGNGYGIWAEFEMR
jgi:hypothetical protein